MVILFVILIVLMIIFIVDARRNHCSLHKLTVQIQKINNKIQEIEKKLV